ncbi:MAG TPA: 6-phosphogluconolactonase [Tepidisphaeraceae bacterium]|jgi:6-phosphogluconolactonase
MAMSDQSIKVLTNDKALADEAARRFVELAGQAIALTGKFNVALAGGSTPKAMYRLLAMDPLRGQVQWENVEIFFGDERCVPPNHPDSNFRMASETLLSLVPIPRQSIHRMRGEIDPNEAAREYGQLLKEKFGDGGLDLCLLGMGDDGHTASLFPGTTALLESKHRCVANYVEKLKAWRITLTAPFINRSREVMVLISGGSKAKRLHEVLEGPRDMLRLPIQLIDPAHGKLTWLVDVPAAGMM